jgi:hypothetical protein
MFLYLLVVVVVVVARTDGKLALLYLANDIVQNSRKKSPQFVQQFALVLPEAVTLLRRCVLPPTTTDDIAI